MGNDLLDIVTHKFSDTSIIKVIGVGGGGGNAVNNMYEEGIENVDFIICNTDKQVLEKSPIPTKIQLGYRLTEGLGAGNNPAQGREAAKESIDDIKAVLENNTKMVFIAAGMGGGTGTGAAPIVAEIAQELKILTVAIVTIPFLYEGNRRVQQAIEGLNELKEHVDSMIVINNEKLIDVYGELEIEEAFKKADEVITVAAKSIAEIITKPGKVNVDFADVSSVMKQSGVAVMGTGYAEGEERAINAVKKAITSPILNNNDIKGAKNLLVNIISPSENKISTRETKIINDYLQSEAGNNANLIWGMTENSELNSNQAAVSVVATDFNSNIIPTFEDVLNENKKSYGNSDNKKNDDDNENNNDEDNNENSKKSKNKKNKTIDDIKREISQKRSQRFDYSDDAIVNDIEEKPAYLRQNIRIDLSASAPISRGMDSMSSFINPMVD